MNKYLLLFAFILCAQIGFSQTELITNGDFEITPLGTGWSTTTSNGSLWVGSANCTGSNATTNYTWVGDQNETSGTNNLNEDLRQAISIPSNASTVVLYFDASINTAESGTTAYDFVTISLQDQGGTDLANLGNISNTTGTYGVTGCQSYAGFFANIPSSLYGQTVYLTFTFTTDGSNPTIFRIDDVSVLANFTTSCTYFTSTNTVTVDGTANNIQNIAIVNTQPGCSWSASVTQGSSWLSTTSSSVGAGQIHITVAQNNTGSNRTGQISVEGNTIQVIQESLACNYTLTTSVFDCPSSGAETYSSISAVTCNNLCPWVAVVTTGSSWLICNSGTTGSGTIDITVLENTTNTARNGVIEIEDKTMIITQPPHWSSTSVDELEVTKSNVYPNPAINTLSINSKYVNGFNYTVIDQMGRTLKTGVSQSESYELQIEDLPEGLYFLRINIHEKPVETLRFIKTK